MNYCDKINYRILTAKKDSFETMVDELLAQLPENEKILRLSLFGTPGNNEQYVSRRMLVCDKLRKKYGEDNPALSYVSQPPLNASLILEVMSYTPDADDFVIYKHLKGFSYVLLKNKNGRFLFTGGFHGNVNISSIGGQSEKVFSLLADVMQKEDFPVNSIIRQWNYIEQITAIEDGNQHYQLFNNARSDFYEHVVWDKGYPAATGIGTNLGGVVIDLDAAVFTSPDFYVTPINNNLQVAAHAYSEDVLIAADKKKSTPKFERAKSMTFGDRKLIYISGTAAIRGEESLTGVGLERQLHITMENIAVLIDKAKPVILRVYLKNPEDFKEAERLMDEYKLKIPISYMCADVCREELLIEIEGIAIL